MKGNFSKIINGTIPVLVDFYTVWCGPCKMQTPILKELGKETANRLRIIKVDVDKNPQISQKYNVRSIPTSTLR